MNFVARAAARRSARAAALPPRAETGGATLLAARGVARPWGRMQLPPGFESFAGSDPVGEIWHEPIGGNAAPLLVKHLFTAERLSVQVHPDDRAAAARGLPRGKDEAWLILDAEPEARLGLGLVRPCDADELRDAALSGAIEHLVDWRAVAAGAFLHSPAGTIHAIGAGLSLIEIQQNCDTTYRLYDYGRPRELHLEDALAVADPAPWTAAQTPRALSPRRTLLADGGSFVVENWRVTGSLRLVLPKTMLLIPRDGNGTVDGMPTGLGHVWSAVGQVALRSAARMDLLVAYPGSSVAEGLIL